MGAQAAGDSSVTTLDAISTGGAESKSNNTTSAAGPATSTSARTATMDIDLGEGGTQLAAA